MSKQVFNTRGLTLDKVKQILKDKKGGGRTNNRKTIEILRSNLDQQLDESQKNDREIDYLENFVARKERELKK